MVVAYQRALEVLTPENDPVVWGATQYSWGSAKGLSRQATGSESVRFVRESIQRVPPGIEGLYP